MFQGLNAVSSSQQDNQIVSISSEAAARLKSHNAQAFVLATGGFLGGGLLAEYDGTVREPVMGLSVSAPGSRSQWFDRQFLSKQGHPIFLSGIETNLALNPLNPDNLPFAENLFAVGSLLAGADTIRERSHQGVDLLTGYIAAQAIDNFL